MYTIIKSNAIFPSTGEPPFKGYLVIKENKIADISVGDPDMKLYCDATLLDFKDKLVMPGFSDAHMHLLIGAVVSSDYCCMDIYESSSEEECVQMLLSFYASHPDLDIIRGFGWFPAKWGDKLPSKDSLDKAFPDIPIILQSADGHSHWLNQKALDLCGISKDSTVAIGSIGKDENGELNGLLFEMEACESSNMKLLTLPEKARQEVYINFFNEMLSYGITSGSDFAITTNLPSDLSVYETLKEMDDANLLKVRLHIYPSLGIDSNFEKAKQLQTDYQSPRYRVCGLKTFFDGVTSTYTAALKEPYADNPSTCGHLNYPKETYEKCIIEANKENFSVRIHALGDYAVSAALDIFEKSKLVNKNYSTLNNCIEHIENIDPLDFSRLSENNITASLQPLHLILDDNEKIARLGEKRCQYEFPWQSFLDHNVNIAFGTDMPVVGLNPFENIHAALTRCDFDGTPSGCNPNEKIKLTDALIAYTAGSARSHGREQELGTLEKGKLADIIALDRNPFETPIKQLKDIRPVFVMVDGEIISMNA